MIYSIYIIDINQLASPLLEHFFAHILKPNIKMEYDYGIGADCGSYYEKEILTAFFNKIYDTIDFLKKEKSGETELHPLPLKRILFLEGYNLIFHYSYDGEFIVASINDLDDNKNTILEVLESLSRRFYGMFRTVMQDYRHSNMFEVFNSFHIDIVNLTLDGTIAEGKPDLIVSENALIRLNRMNLISEEELKIAKLIKNRTSLYEIAKILDWDYDEVDNALVKLKNLDIIQE